MEIIKDAMRILAFTYKKGKTHSGEIIADNGWEILRVRTAINFLEKDELIERPRYMADGSVILLECSVEGIKMIENPELLKQKYGTTINIKVHIDSILKTDSIFKASLL